jgi:hypothetical protein
LNELATLLSEQIAHFLDETSAHGILPKYEPGDHHNDDEYRASEVTTKNAIAAPRLNAPCAMYPATDCFKILQIIRPPRAQLLGINVWLNRLVPEGAPATFERPCYALTEKHRVIFGQDSSL